ncbi:hypothetical protein DL95DRAFT_139816 [Leptodontidium sp. 2 PMI_412]|nr:hypothetical protein DL95DRAFT_139816 [Leptodontidium sp. 2 PMI_412]
MPWMDDRASCTAVELKPWMTLPESGWMCTFPRMTQTRVWISASCSPETQPVPCMSLSLTQSSAFRLSSYPSCPSPSRGFSQIPHIGLEFFILFSFLLFASCSMASAFG